MIKPKDQTTDGKGTKPTLMERLKALLGEADEADESNADQDGTDTSADELEGKDESDNEETETPDGEDESGADDDESDAEGEPKKDGNKPTAPAAKDEKKYSESEVEAMIKKRLAKQKTSMSKKEISPLEAEVEAMKKELAAIRAAGNESVKADFEKLPAEIKALAPADASTDEGVAAIKEWMPRVKTLLDKLDKTEVVKKSGNGNDPKALTAQELKDEAALKAKVKEHTIYKTW